jgi:hypothetical protein
MRSNTQLHVTRDKFFLEANPSCINESTLICSFFIIQQNISQVQGTGENMDKEQFSSKGVTVKPASLFSTQSARETSTTTSSSHYIAGMFFFWQTSYMLYVSILYCSITFQ